MIEIHRILKEKEIVIDLLKKRNLDLSSDINYIHDVEIERRDYQKLTDGLRHELNILSTDISNRERCTILKQKIKKNLELMNGLEKEIFNLLVKIPNIPSQDVPFGKGYDDNTHIYQKNHHHPETKGQLKHWELIDKYKIGSFDLGNKITGRGFPVYIDKGAKLQRSIINFCLEEATKFGFIEYEVPILVNKESVFGTGQYPDKDDQMYFIDKDDLYLVPTAEVPLTNIWRDVILDKIDLPILATSYTPCFRREAGTYGKDVRGLNRLHQFDKVELVCITTQDDSDDKLNLLTEYVKSLLDKLKLTHRVLQLCGADMGFGAAKSYDIEAWCPSQEKWLEVATITNFETFQSNRLKCRYKNGNEKKLTHTLNGTGLALPRIVATILETYQVDDGIIIPDCLVEFTKFNKIQ